MTDLLKNGDLSVQIILTKHIKGLSSGKGLLVWHGSSIHDPSQYYSLDGTAFGAECP